MQGAGPPVVFVLGPTASGKSSLAMCLARALRAEIVNADAMQLYAGAVIATNKPTPEEMREVAHHLVGTVGEREAVTVQQYVAMANKAVREVLGRGRAVLVVGGTAYYALSLLFANRTVEAADVDLAGMRLEAKRALLEQHDPSAAARIDPGDERKTTRALSVWLSRGETVSELHARQDRHKLRYGECRVIVTDRGNLEDTIRTRVDEMVAKGLIEEAKEFIRKWGTEAAIDCERGIWQSIGLKEFLDDKTSPEEAVLRVKNATIRYAKKQRKMLRNSVCPLLDHVAVATDGDVKTDQLCAWIATGLEQPNVAVVRATKGEGKEEEPVERIECCGKRLTGRAAIEQHTRGKLHKATKRREKLFK